MQKDRIDGDKLKTLDRNNSHANTKTTSNIKKLIISRLLVVLCFAMMLLFGIITRIYIHIIPYNATLCNSSSTGDNFNLTGYSNQVLGNDTFC